MTLAACGVMFWPAKQTLTGQTSSGGGALAATFDSNTDRVAWTGTSPVADTIDVVYFRTGTVTTGCTVQVQIESVGADGRPSGTILAAGANTTVAIADGDDNVWKTATIGTPPSVSQGDKFAIVITYSSGSTPSIQFAATAAIAAADLSANYPSCWQDTGAGTWVIVSGVTGSLGIGAWEWVVEFGSAGVVPLPCLSPLNGAITLNAITSSSTPDEYALRFKVPFKCRAIGVNAAVFNTAAGADFTLSLWPASSTTDGDALTQAVVDGDYANSTTADGNVMVYFPTSVTLSAGTTYYLGFRSDTANSVSIGTMSAAGTDAAANAIRAFGIPATGEVYLSTRSWTAGSAGAWTDTTTSIALLNLIIDQLDDGAGASGGGMRLAGRGGLAA